MLGFDICVKARIGVVGLVAVVKVGSRHIISIVWTGTLPDTGQEPSMDTTVEALRMGGVMMRGFILWIHVARVTYRGALEISGQEFMITYWTELVHGTRQDSPMVLDSTHS